MKIINVSAIWCPSCLIMRSRINEIKKMYPHIEIEEYDYDENEDLVNEMAIGKILPVFIFMNNDKEIKRLIGEKTVKELSDCIEEVEKM